MRIVTGKCLISERCALISIIISVCIILMLGMVPQRVCAANISEKKLTLYEGETKTLKVLGVSKKIQWKSSKRRFVTVSTKGKVTAKQVGTATIIAKAGRKTFKCIVTVKKPNGSQRLQMAKRETKKIIRKYIFNDMNTVERAYVLFRWLSDNCAWQKNQSAAAYRKNFGNEAYAALVLKKAACSGCAKAYMMLCKMAKVPVRHINPNNWTHQWNEVKVGRRWLKVDTYGGTFESTKGVRKSLLDRETYNEKGKKEIPLYSFIV